MSFLLPLCSNPARGQHRPQGASSRGVRGEGTAAGRRGCGGTDRAGVGAYLQQHPGDAGEGRAHLQEQRHHGQVVAGLEVDCAAEIPQEGEEVVHGQEAVEGAEERVGHMKGEVLEEEEAGGRGDVEPAPVLLAERLVGLEHGVQQQRPQPRRGALDAEDRACGRQVPEDLLTGRQRAVGGVQEGGQPVAGHKDAQVEGTARGHQRPAHLPRGVVQVKGTSAQEAHAARVVSARPGSTHRARAAAPGPSCARPQPGEEWSLTFCWPDGAARRPRPRQGEGHGTGNKPQPVHLRLGDTHTARKLPLEGQTRERQ